MKKPPSDRKLFAFGTLIGFIVLSIALAAVPRSRITDDTAIYQKLSEIRVPREQNPNFDGDIARLSKLEGRYRESLPLAKQPRVAAPMGRIQQQKYQFTGSGTK